MKTTTDFYRQVIRLIKMIPSGKVATYGQIAKLAGKPQGSRGVAWILHSSSDKESLPWHRVLGSQGRISFPVGTSFFRKQRRMLLSEGVDVSREGRLDLAEYQWEKKPRSLKKSPRTPRMFS